MAVPPAAVGVVGEGGAAAATSIAFLAAAAEAVAAGVSGEGGVGGGPAEGLPEVADAVPAATAAAWTADGTVATAAAATAAALRALTAVIPHLHLVVVRAIATAVARVPEKREVALNCVAVVAAMASGLVHRDAAVRRGAAASAAVVLSSGVDTARGVVAAWEVDREVVAAAMGRGCAKRTSPALKRRTATARWTLNHACS